jgi:DNA replication protein DnaC
MERRAVEALAARRAELERLEAFAFGDEPLVMHIHGIPGVGKTHLLNALASSLGAKGVVVVRIDARWFEPSPAAFCRAISKETGVP